MKACWLRSRGCRGTLSFQDVSMRRLERPKLEDFTPFDRSELFQRQKIRGSL